MAQLFSRRADSVFRFTVACVLATVFGAFVVAEGIAHSNYVTGRSIVLPQPVAFSHQHHAGELGIDCRFCHMTVETAATAGMPSTYVCMTCHSQIWTGAPMLAPVRDSLAHDQPLVWQRVYGLPEYVYFDHAVHIAKGIGCSSCHGDMDRMQMTRQALHFSMAFCVACHRNPRDYVRPRKEIWNMSWHPPANQATRGAQLVRMYHIDTSGRLTDCSVCHR